MTTSTAQDTLIDLRSIPRPQRHALVFERLVALGGDDSLQLINDHPPLPLLHQIEQQWPGQFGVAALDEGPAVWRFEFRRADPAAAALATTRAAGGSCCSGGNCCG